MGRDTITERPVPPRTSPRAWTAKKELSERLRPSFSGAKSRVQRAREKLKQQLLECCHL